MKKKNFQIKFRNYEINTENENKFNKDKEIKTQKNIRICKFGERCRDLKRLLCRFFHPIEHLKLLNLQSKTDEQLLNKKYFIPESFNTDQINVSKNKLNFLANIRDENKLQKHLKLKQIKLLTQCSELNFGELLNLFVVFENIYLMTDEKFKRFFFIEIMNQNFFSNNKTEQFRNIIIKKLENLSFNEMFKLVQGFTTLWRIIDSLSDWVPNNIKKLEIEFLYKFSIMIHSEGKKLIRYAFNEHEKSLKKELKFFKIFILKIKSKIEELEKLYKDPKIKEQQLIKPEKIQLSNDEFWEPPDNFRLFSDYPIKEEFTNNQKSYIKPLPQDKTFPNIDTYLDMNYRLLKEDFISCVRNGLNTYYRSIKHPTNNEKNFDLTNYKNVNVIAFISTENFSGLCLRIPYKPSKKKLSWQKMKKLVFGSMILISKNFFEDFEIAIIKYLDRKKMDFTMNKFGFVDIYVEIINSDKNLIANYEYFKNSSCELLESRCYFEAYFYVLKTLKSFYSFPLQDLIVGSNPDLNRQPFYLFGNSEFNDAIKDLTDSYSLNTSQKDAITNAFSHKLSIIQGPPGTGKTYVGVKIMDILLHLKQNYNIPTGPIFIVCYTNHALDQFLMKILDLTKKICRLGGRTKEEILENFSLYKLSKFNEIKKSYIYSQIKNEIRSTSEKINELIFNFIYIEQTGLSNKPILEKYKFLGDNFYEYLVEKFEKEKFKFTSKIRNANDKKKFDNLFEIMTQYFRFPSIFYWLGMIDFSYIYNCSKNFQFINYCKKYYMNKDLKEESDNNNEDDFIAEQELYLTKVSDLEKLSNNLLNITNLLFSLSCESSFKTIKEAIDYYMETFVTKNNLFKITKIFQEIQQNNKEIDIFKLSLQERWQLNFLIIQHNKKLMSNAFDILENDKQRYNKELESVEKENEIDFLNKLDVIGMTTTGAVKYKNIMDNINSQVMIVEEAAEVLECQIIASISPKIQHLILIGDHLQLKPAVNNYDLVKNYNFDISLFERLINKGFENAILNEQRRMRPEISTLVKFIYPNLKDHSSVFNRKNVRGIPTNLFFFHHENEESESTNGGSKINEFEAAMIIEFTKHIIHQKYSPTKITILSLYNGQLLLLKSLSSKNPEVKNVLIKTVDDYQGEENEIIILSLVRSNKKDNIGFLKIANRVCVALSRARRALYIFGNAVTLRNAMKSSKDSNKLNFNINDFENKCSLWENILAYLKSKKLVLDRKIHFVCIMHKNSTIIESPEDFKKMPQGGCQELCKARLECGHSCKSVCHVFKKTIEDQTGHNDYNCLSVCDRIRTVCDHKCDYKCYECKKGHKPCKVKIEKIYECGHVNKLECDFYQKNKGLCFEQCDKQLSCGHKCLKKCYENCNSLYGDIKYQKYTSPCTVKVLKQLSCGHKTEIECGFPVKYFEQTQKYICKEKCGKKLEECFHLCQENCNQCLKNIFHQDCQQKCKKSLICNHECQDKCMTENACSPCILPCEVACEHSHCQKDCGDICKNCLEPCNNKCIHSKCTNKCYQECNKLPCIEKCNKKLNCQHDCIGLCGDECPPICRICDSEHETFQIFFGNEDELDARFVYLPDCKHIIEVNALDTFMQQENTKSIIQYPNCPKCKTTIRKCQRYQKIIKKINNKINQVKKIVLDQIKNLKNKLLTNNLINQVNKNIMHLESNFYDDFLCLKSNTIIQKIKQISQTINKRFNTFLKRKSVIFYHITFVYQQLLLFNAFIEMIISNKNINKMFFKKNSKFLFFYEFFTANYFDLYKFKKLYSILECIKIYLQIAVSINEYEIYGNFYNRLNNNRYEISLMLQKFKKLFVSENFLSSNENLEISKNLLKRINVDIETKNKFKESIIKAIGLPKGHWFSCPNGHVYVIGECGGAMEESKCPDCKQKVGGTQHQLLNTNMRASFFDGSTRDAYNTDDDLNIARRLQREYDDEL